MVKSSTIPLDVLDAWNHKVPETLQALATTVPFCYETSVGETKFDQPQKPGEISIENPCEKSNNGNTHIVVWCFTDTSN